MPEIQCVRCGSSAEGLSSSPFPGEVGQKILEATCANCWKEWLKAQVILINEERLSPANPEHYRKLVAQMKQFLAIESTNR